MNSKIKTIKKAAAGILAAAVVACGMPALNGAGLYSATGTSITAYAAEKSETISLVGDDTSNTATGSHFKVTCGYLDIDDSGLTINKFGPMTVSSLDGTIMTKVVWSYEWGKNAGTLSATPGTFNGSNTVTEINSTGLTVSSTSPAGVTLNSITIYYEVDDVPATATYTQEGEDYQPQFDGDTAASLWRVTVTSGTDAITSLNVKVNGTASGEDAWTDLPEITDSTVVFGVAVNSAADGVKSVTAVVNGEDVAATKE